ncbi:MAG: outer membrane protein assembly factor BamE [gamma proteobacterium symbiont of Bathyaustriella thionipta]|nr:outer membrane protein assembly factor BamE [gamma proteobacterium symbiont of Bathyaustriella thionipta]
MIRKLLITSLLLASVINGGCAFSRSVGEATSQVPKAMALLAPVYQAPVQQGNVVTQNQVNQLQPGMSKRQVNFLLGTTLLVDPFHQNRWDYFYSYEKAGDLEQKENLTVLFDDNRLVSIQGDFHPEPYDAMQEQEDIVVEVPDQEEDTGYITRMLRAISLDEDS